MYIHTQTHMNTFLTNLALNIQHPIGYTMYLLCRKHGVIKTYMDDLYRGCDILELVGRGKKSTALMKSKGTASIIAEAIDAKIDAME